MREIMEREREKESTGERIKGTKERQKGKLNERMRERQKEIERKKENEKKG